MWDAWAAYDPVADGYFVDEKQTAPATSRRAREEAISFAAYRILTHRYGTPSAARTTSRSSTDHGVAVL